MPIISDIAIVSTFYAPNFKEVGGAYWLLGCSSVRPSVRPSVRHAFRCKA